MSSGHRGVPWLSRLRREALGSAEWAQISRLIEERVRGELGSRGLAQWADLSEQEKAILLNEVGEEVRSHAAFKVFFSRLGTTIDDTLLQEENIAHSAREELRKQRADARRPAPGGPEGEDTHALHDALERQPRRHPDIALLLDIASEGASELLRQAPNSFHTLRVIGCRGLPAHLRLEVWRLQLRNASVRNEYVAMAAEDRLSVFSKKDPEIAKSCRTLLDAEFDDGSLGDIQLSCKSILSYIHRRHGGLIASPLRYVAIVLVWALHSTERGAQLDNASLVEFMFALLEETGYRSFFDLHSADVQQAKFQELVAQVSEHLHHADPSVEQLLASLASTTTDEATLADEKTRFDVRLFEWWASTDSMPSLHVRQRVEARLRARSPWDFHSSPMGGSVGVGSRAKMMFQLLLPLVQRLFAGMLHSLDETCRIWDTLLLLGAQVLPHVCASYLLAVRRYAVRLLPKQEELEFAQAASQASSDPASNSDDQPPAPPPAPSLQHWEWALNATCDCVRILDVQAVFEKYFLPDLQKKLHIREARQTLLAAILPAGHGQLQRLSPAGDDGVGVGGASGGGASRGNARRRALAAGVSSYTQTEGWAEVKGDVHLQELAANNAQPAYIAERLMSPRAHVTREEAEVVGADGAEGGGEQVRTQAPAQQQQQQQQQHSVKSPVKRAGKSKAAVVETVQLWYGGRIFSLVIPEEVMTAVSAIAARRNGVQNVRGPEERLSSVADRVLRHPQNEELLSAVIALERKLPSPVARVQGNQLRPPMESNVDVPLFAALADKLPLLQEDYSKPMLRFDLVLNMPSSKKAPASASKLLAAIGEEQGAAGAAGGTGGGETHQVVIELYVAPLKAGDVVLGTEAVEEACREAGILKGLSTDHIARMARALEEYSHVPPRHSEPRRADYVVAVRRPGERRGVGGAAEGLPAGGAAGGQGAGVGSAYEIDVVAVESPSCVGVNIKIERRVDQIVNDLMKKDASIRLPLQADPLGAESTKRVGGGGRGLSEWEKAARDLVLSNICKQLTSVVKVKSHCFEPAGLHVHGDHILVDVNIHHQPDLSLGKAPQHGQAHARGRAHIANDREGEGGLSALQIYDMVQQQIADPGSALHKTFLSATTRLILRGQPHAIWKTKPFNAPLPRSQKNLDHVVPATQGQQQAFENLLREEAQEAGGGRQKESEQRGEGASGHPAGGDSSLASIAEEPGAPSAPVSAARGNAREKELIAATAAAVAAEAAATLGVSLNGRGEGEDKEILPGVKIYYESRADGKKKSIGPVYFAAFKELVDTRVIHIHTRVWRKPPGGEWKRLVKDTELMDLLAPTDEDKKALIARDLEFSPEERERERERDLLGNNVHDGGVQGAAR